MNEIAVTVREVSAALALLEEQSEQISSIVGVIHEIADQTNLLALNAAIEAADRGIRTRFCGSNRRLANQKNAGRCKTLATH
ncbi:hypothetical protein AGMMS50225_04880 [Betaproteobacteria bacterium]|nr:hypothetical protein AGMMS50225_04880 [Betaproteobacteria bacterium]